MSKHNYSQYSKKTDKPKQNNSTQRQRPDVPEVKRESPAVKMDSTPIMKETSPVVRPSLVTTPNVVQSKPQLVQETSRVVRPSLVNETVETVSLPKTVEGVVVHCAKLNVRENATVDSSIVIVLDAMSEIEIDVNKSTENWYYIYSATGAEGYCMKQYVEARL